MPTIVQMTGFEHGSSLGLRNGLGGQTQWDYSDGTEGGTILVQNTNTRTGAGYACRFTCTSSAQADLYWTASGGAPGNSLPVASVLVGRFWWCPESLTGASSGDVPAIAHINSSGGGNSYIEYHESTGQLSLVLGSGATQFTASSVITVGTWYAIDFRLDMSGSTWTCDWRVNGAAQTQATQSASADHVTEFRIGCTSLFNIVMSYDDILLSQTSADYPLPDAHIIGLPINGSGTHGNPSHFEQTTNNGSSMSAISSPETVVDDLPPVVGASTDAVAQVTADASGYLEFTHNPMPPGTVYAVKHVIAAWVSGAAATNVAVVLRDGLNDGDTLGTPSAPVNPNWSWSTSTLGWANKTYAAPPSGGTWSRALVNSLRTRIGWATTVTAQPGMNAAYLEVATGAPVAPVEAAVPAGMQVIVPAYVYPGDAMLNNIQESVPPPAFVIMNQNSGDTLMAGTWLTEADTLRAAGSKVLAYVYTNATTRPIADVKASINKQLVTGDGIVHFDGIFMDLTTRDVGSSSGLTDYLDYYTTLYSYVRTTAESAQVGTGADMIVVHNPGTAVDDRYVTTPAADYFVTFEGTQANYNTAWLGGNVFSLPSGVYRLGTDLPAGKFAHLVHTVDDASAMATVINTAYRRNAGLVYATDDILPNPWDVTPTWGFDDEISDVSSIGPVTFARERWQNGSAGGTPIDAASLNREEAGIGNTAARVWSVQATGETTKQWATFRGRGSDLIRGMAAPTLTAMSSPPTLTWNGGSSGGPSTSPTQIAGSVYISPTDARLYYYSGPPVAAFAYQASPTVYGPSTAPSLTQSQSVGYLGFDFDGQTFEVAIFGSNQQQFRIWVNGQPHTASPVAVTPSDFNHYLLKVDFGSRAYRHVIIEGAGNAFTGWYWGGLRALPSDTVTNPSTGATSPTLIVFGDSYVAGVTGTNAAQGWAPLCGQMLGWGNTWVKGVGGTGFLADNSGADLNYGNRALHELYGTTADAIVVQGSINDDSYAGMSSLDRAIGNLLDGLLANTTATVFLTSILRVPSADDVTINAQLAAAAATRPDVVYIDASAFMYGTGDASSPTGDGNADYYLQSNDHPTQAGHYALAKFVSSHIAQHFGVATI